MSGVEARDEQYMKLALRLAARVRGRTSPNPLVGAVIVKDGEVVGRGYHRRAGEPHAEITAINDAGERARGATIYVNLEPCNHRGKTGPCTRSVIAAGIRRVVIGMKDPNPVVNGKGIAALRRKGIQVVTGALEAECRRLNEAFEVYITASRPFVTFKSAVTLDGRVATRTGDSRWVTGEVSRREGHRLRNHSDAIMVGVKTVLDDDPQLTCRGIRGGKDPTRIVLDSMLRTPPEARVVTAVDGSRAPTWIVTSDRAPRNRDRALTERGARVIRLPADGRRVQISRVLQALGAEEIQSVLLEGGPTVAGAFWDAGLIDRLIVFIAPKILGDPAARPMVNGAPLEVMARATSLVDVEVRRLGADIMLTGRPRDGGGD